MYRREKKLIFCKNRERKQRKIAVILKINQFLFKNNEADEENL